MTAEIIMFIPRPNPHRAIVIPIEIVAPEIFSEWATSVVLFRDEDKIAKPVKPTKEPI